MAVCTPRVPHAYQNHMIPRQHNKHGQCGPCFFDDVRYQTSSTLRPVKPLCWAVGDTCIATHGGPGDGLESPSSGTGTADSTLLVLWFASSPRQCPGNQCLPVEGVECCPSPNLDLFSCILASELLHRGPHPVSITTTLVSRLKDGSAGTNEFVQYVTLDIENSLVPKSRKYC